MNTMNTNPITDNLIQAITLTMEVYDEPNFVAWAQGWLCGSNRLMQAGPARDVDWRYWAERWASAEDIITEADKVREALGHAPVARDKAHRQAWGSIASTWVAGASQAWAAGDTPWASGAAIAATNRAITAARQAALSTSPPGKD